MNPLWVIAGFVAVIALGTRQFWQGARLLWQLGYALLILMLIAFLLTATAKGAGWIWTTHRVEFWAVVVLLSGGWLFDVLGKLWNKTVRLDKGTGLLLLANVSLCIWGIVEVRHVDEQQLVAVSTVVPCTPGPVKRMTEAEFKVFVDRVEAQLPVNRTFEQLKAAVKAQRPHSCDTSEPPLGVTPSHQ